MVSACVTQWKSYGSVSYARPSSNATDTATSTASMGIWKKCQRNADRESTSADERRMLRCPHQTSYMGECKQGDNQKLWIWMMTHRLVEYFRYIKDKQKETAQTHGDVFGKHLVDDLRGGIKSITSECRN